MYRKQIEKDDFCHKNKMMLLNKFTDQFGYICNEIKMALKRLKIFNS